MNKRDFNEFKGELESLIDDYSYDDAWNYNECWFSNGQGSIIFEFDDDEDSSVWNWCDDFWDDFEGLCQEWGADYDYDGSLVYKVGFNL